MIMCGPSSAQEGLANQASSFSTTLNQNYSKNFAAQSDILKSLTSMFQPIAAAGPDQQGFGPQELAALNTQSGEGVGANYAKASQALNTTLAARGGGNEVLPSGADAALRGSLASSAANELSSEQLGITRANYTQGRSNWGQATAGLNALAQEYNPNAIAGEATSAGSAAFGEQSQIQQMKNQKEMAIAGGVASLAMAPFTGGASLTGLTGGGGSGGGFSMPKMFGFGGGKDPNPNTYD